MGYRIVDPVGAQALLVRVQSWFADDVEPIIVQQDPIDVTVSTWVVSHTWFVDSGTEQIVVIPMSTGVQTNTSHIATGKSVVTPSIPTKATPRPQNQSALSDQDMKDLQRLLNAIVE